MTETSELSPLLKQLEQSKSKVADSEETVLNNPEHSLIYNALTSKVFKKRVEAGLRMVRRRRYPSESGISIISNGHEIVYPPLKFYKPDPNDYRAHYFQSVPPGHNISKEWFLKHQNLDDYLVIADFHFHTLFMPYFSGGDMKAYANRLNRYKIIDEIVKKYGSVKGMFATDYEWEEMEGEIFKYRPDMVYGVFSPMWRWQDDQHKKRECYGLKLFMISGPPTNDDYLKENFDQESKQQKEILERSGMKVTQVELPVEKDRISLEPLKTELVKF